MQVAAKLVSQSPSQVRRLGFLGLIILALFGLSGCDDAVVETVDVRSRGFTVFDGAAPVIDGELVERRTWLDGVLVDSQTSMILVNRSGFDIEMDLELSTGIWAERVSINYLEHGGIIDLGIISRDYLALRLPSAEYFSTWITSGLDRRPRLK